METRPIVLEHDYSTLEGWWLLNKWQPVPRDVLPSNGLIVEHNAAGFIYLTSNSPMAWMEWIVANPLCDRIERSKAINLIITGLLDIAVRAGKTMVFSSSSNKSLSERFIDSGAIVGDRNVTHYIWKVGS